ncbi:MAG: hypothetical protein IPK60_05385 [Sandaracinaceae bacterium]|jgi:phosphohistidine swiveling domain-containing protein|nr:hypothetical protein [Sandaracinaceae bacterium]
MSGIPLLRRIETIVPRRAEGFGGKAKNLAALARAGFPVPAAYALSGDIGAAFIAEALPEDDRIAALLAAPENVVNEARLRRLKERVRTAPLSDGLVRALQQVLADLRREGAHAVAVRSSSTREDDEAASAAGLHSTFLNIVDEQGLFDAVRACFASAFEPRVIAYLKTVSGAVDAAVGVVVQAMVPADVSGVLFTVNPLTGDSNEMVLNAAYGLGELVVDGRVSPDSYRIEKSSGFVRDRVLGEKQKRAVGVLTGGTREEAVSESESAREALSEHTIADLVALGRRVEAHFGDARDIEWAIASGTLYVLQARPVTALSLRPSAKKARKPREAYAARAKIVWSNVNVGEALPGVATPLTWSVLSQFSDLGFRRAFGSMGCSVPKDAELVGSFRGRIYLNLTEMVAIASQVPGLSPKTILSFGGGGEVETLEASIEPRGHTAFLMRLPLTAARFVRENFAIGRRVEAFERAFREEFRRIQSIDLRILSAAALAHTLNDVENLLDETGAIMLTCYGNLLSSTIVLHTVLRALVGDRVEMVERSLTTGLADLESAAPGTALWHIAEMARADAPAREKVLNGDTSKMRVSSLPEGPTRRALEKFIAAYGGRGPREAEIAEPRWREDPSLLFVTLRLHLQSAPDAARNPLAIEQRQRQLRAEAEAEIETRLLGPTRAAFRHLLALVQRFVRLRERLRAHSTDVLGLYRGVAREASRRIDSREHCGRDSAFFLTVEELRAYLTGRLSTVATLVRARRMQFERDVSLPDPPDTFVGFPPPAPPPAPDTNVLSGLASSGGVVEGVAHVLMSPADAGQFRAGEILVAPYADVGWSPLFLVAGALVTDLGGPLSHAAIVAREYGLPAVMNVKVGTRVIRSGDVIRVDGDAGTVQIVTPAAQGEPRGV